MPSEYTSALEFLLLSPCLMPGLTSHTDSKAKVHIIPKLNETILFFCIDDQTKNNSHCQQCGLRQFLWGNTQGKNICDLIIFYACGEKRRIICFVELKDNLDDLGKSVTQVINTYNAVKQKLKLNNNYRAKAFIAAHHGSAPREHQRYEKKLKDAFGDSNYEYTCKGNELDKFLRGESDEDIGKGKRKKSKK